MRISDYMVAVLNVAIHDMRMHSNIDHQLTSAAAVQRAAAEGVLNERPYKRLIMALFTWAALSAGISLMYRDLWDPRALM